MKNSCFVIGNLGADPALRSKTAKGDPIVGFAVAENIQSFDAESRQWKTLHTNWFSVTAFGALAERVLAGLKKGDRVAVHGRMRTSRFEDKSGSERASFEIVAENVARWQPLRSAPELEPGPGEEPLPF